MPDAPQIENMPNSMPAAPSGTTSTSSTNGTSSASSTSSTSSTDSTSNADGASSTSSILTLCATHFLVFLRPRYAVFGTWPTTCQKYLVHQTTNEVRRGYNETRSTSGSGLQIISNCVQQVCP
jgi:hypothetical protein